MMMTDDGDGDGDDGDADDEEEEDVEEGEEEQRRRERNGGGGWGGGERGGGGALWIVAPAGYELSRGRSMMIDPNAVIFRVSDVPSPAITIASPISKPTCLSTWSLVVPAIAFATKVVETPTWRPPSSDAAPEATP